MNRNTRILTRSAMISTALIISPALASTALGWHAEGSCISNDFVVTNPDETWNTGVAFVADGDQITTLSVGQSVTISGDVAVVKWADASDEAPVVIARPTGCATPVATTIPATTTTTTIAPTIFATDLPPVVTTIPAATTSVPANVSPAAPIAPQTPLTGPTLPVTGPSATWTLALLAGAFVGAGALFLFVRRAWDSHKLGD